MNLIVASGGLCLIAVFSQFRYATAETCSDLLAAEETDENRDKVLACQLYETAALVSEMGDAIVGGLGSVLIEKGVEEEQAGGGDGGNMEKRKHEYLRFGKRKHEYLRFGKRKHEYLRFGKRKHEYLRFGKRKHEYLRFGKRKHEYLRFGKRALA